MADQIIQVDPRILRLPTSRRDGADPIKLARHIARFGAQVAGMPPLELTKGKDGVLMINSGVTRATRAAKLTPGQMLDAIIIDDRPNWDLSGLPTVQEKLP
jgi:hypothetical protein